MKCDKHTMLLYAVTDRAWVGPMTLLQQAEAALQNGVTCLQLREKHLDDEAFLAEARQMAALCKRYHVPLIINDRVDIALACGADGVHVGQEDMEVSAVRRLAGEKLIVGVSAHTVEEAVKAARGGADYLGLGAVFSTSTKADAGAMSRDTLKAICQAVDIPKVAIGGISAENILQLSGSGVDGVAVVSAIFGAPDPGRAAARLARLSRQMIAGQ